jgi:hypothetical protein
MTTGDQVDDTSEQETAWPGTAELDPDEVASPEDLRLLREALADAPLPERLTARWEEMLEQAVVPDDLAFTADEAFTADGAFGTAPDGDSLPDEDPSDEPGWAGGGLVDEAVPEALGDAGGLAEADDLDEDADHDT